MYSFRTIHVSYVPIHTPIPQLPVTFPILRGPCLSKIVGSILFFPSDYLAVSVPLLILLFRRLQSAR
ncbi:hypothetical protein CBS147343_3496 [Aspergillus niger]|nr:hypothetical protein CBS147344_5709 [Aspergillus niger]KAI3010665.1 hypothetical protein CBS147346_1430 [Aspergillus niger]KAI3079999.1 hypothetical protein CBS147343_3496 [Aspergillus niger]